MQCLYCIHCIYLGPFWALFNWSLAQQETRRVSRDIQQLCEPDLNSQRWGKHHKLCIQLNIVSQLVMACIWLTLVTSTRPKAGYTLINDQTASKLALRIDIHSSLTILDLPIGLLLIGQSFPLVVWSFWDMRKKTYPFPIWKWSYRYKKPEYGIAGLREPEQERGVDMLH